MAEKPFRVLLDLTDLRIESFKYVWISVSPRELKTIAEFKQSLLRKINLGTENIKLFVRDGLLLDEETIIVLREDDTVKVQYEKESYTFQDTSENFTKSKSCRKRNISECYEEDISVNGKRYKKDINVPSTTQNETYLEDVNNKTKKKHKKFHRSSHEKYVCSNIQEDSKNVSGKCKKKSKDHSSLTKVNSVDSNSHDNYVSLPPFETQHNISENCKKDVQHDRNMTNKAAASVTFETGTKDSLSNKIINKSEVESNTHDQLNISNSTTGFTSNCPKKKRRRHRKRKKKDLVNEVLPNVNSSSEYNSFSTEISSDISKRKHIIFTSCSTEKVEDNPEVINLDSNDNCDTNTTCNMYTEDVQMIDQNNHCYPKVSTPAQSNGCADPNWQVSLMQNCNSDPTRVEVHSVTKQSVKSSKYSKTNPAENLKKTSEENSDKNESCHDLPYAKLPSLNSIPDVGAHIVYKILELNENYSPEVSEYREGVVKSIDPESDEMEIELLKHEVKPGRTGKFENLKNDEVPAPEIKKTDIVCWSALIEPKLISR